MGWFIWEIIVNIVTVSAECFLLYSHLGMKTKKEHFVIGVCLVVITISIINYLNINWVILITPHFALYPTRLIMTALLVVFSFIFCNGNISEKILWSFIPMLILAIADMIPIIVMSAITNQSAFELEPFGIYRFIMTLLHIAIVVGACLLLAHAQKRKLCIPVWLCIILIVILILGTLSVDIMIDHIAVGAQNGIFTFNLSDLALLLTFLVIIISILILVTRVGILSFENMEYALEMQQKTLENKAFQDIEIAMTQLRELKHEMKNNFIIMHGLLQNKKYDELSTYFNTLHGEIDQATDFIITEIPTLNSLLYSKILLMKTEQIVFSHQINIAKDIPIQPLDLCSISGNLLDNAIEATKKLEISSRYIRFSMKQYENMLIIKMENSYNGITKQSGKRYLSTKAGRNHGLGLRHIERIVKSYKGHIHITPTNAIFAVTVVLPY